MFVVDTNILVYAANRDSPFHRPCRRLVEESMGRRSAWYLTWGICYEFLRVVTHPRVLRSPWRIEPAWKFLGTLLDSAGLGVLLPTDRHRGVIEELLREVPRLAGNIIHDVHTAALMREHGIGRIYTRDTDFHRFPFLDVVDPAIETA